VCRLRGDGRLGVSRNPAGAAAAWWCGTVKVGPVIRAARRHSGDVPAAVAWTQHTGVLHEFDQEYRRRLLAAQGTGERFMGYAQAMA